MATRLNEFLIAHWEGEGTPDRLPAVRVLGGGYVYVRPAERFMAELGEPRNRRVVALLFPVSLISPCLGIKLPVFLRMMGQVQKG